jgi:hypothetical protein
MMGPPPMDGLRWAADGGGRGELAASPPPWVNWPPWTEIRAVRRLAGRGTGGRGSPASGRNRSARPSEHDTVPGAVPRRFIGALLRAPGAWAVLSMVAAARPAYAESDVIGLIVLRTPESQACPDAARIVDAARALFPQRPLRLAGDAEPVALRVGIRIRRTTEGYEALLTAEGSQQGERRIVARDDDCRGLDEALAVALMLMVEPDARPRQLPPPARPVAATGSSGRQQPARPVVGVSAEGGALGAVGWLGHPAWGGFLGVALWQAVGFGLRVRAVRLLATPHQSDRGSIRADLWAAALGPCWRLEPSSQWAFAPCLDLGVGSQHGVAEGFVTTYPEGRRAPWVVLGPSLTADRRLFGPLRGTVTWGVTARLRGQRFYVEQGPDQEQELVGTYLGLGLSLSWPASDRPGGR